MNENIISEMDEKIDAGDIGDTSANGTTTVKALSGKTNDEIKKTLDSLQDSRSTGNTEDFVGDRLFQEFNEILSTERIGALN